MLFFSDSKFITLKNYSDDLIWNQIEIGCTITMGYFDNDVKIFFKHLPKLRRIFELRSDLIRYEIMKNYL